MKKYFVTGLVILLPVTMTVYISLFFLNFLTNPFIEFFSPLFESFTHSNSVILFWSAEQFVQYFSRILILLLLFIAIVFIGILTRHFFLNYLISLSDKIIHKIPLVNTIYKTSKEVIHTIFQDKTNNFKQVVLVPYPCEKTKTLGLVTQSEVGYVDASLKGKSAVFVPTTPNPTSGFLLMYDQNQITHLEMSPEDALKMIISCGIVSSDLVEKIEEEK